jgi:hypothetical protein
MGNVAERIIQDDVNFKLEIVDWQGQPAVKKSIKPTTPQTRADRIKNDVYGMQFFEQMLHKNQNLPLHVPRIYDFGEGYYVREYVADQSVVEEGMDIAEAGDRLKKLASLLANIDRIEPYGEVRFIGSSNYRNLHKSIGEWANENVRDQIVTPAIAERVKQISAGLGQYIKPRIAHGDMSPYRHAYLRPDNKITLIDFENFTPQAARYFDVAWTYTRLYSFASSTDIPKQFLATFLELAEPVAHRTEQLMAVLIQRILGMQKDADVDLTSKGIDHRDRAKELLELVLQNKLELLHS